MSEPEIITIASNAVVAKLAGTPSRDAKLEVSKILTYTVAGSEHAQSFKTGHWDGRSSFFDFRTCVFPAGFVHLVQAHLSRAGYKVNWVRKPLPVALGVENPKVDKFPEDPRYDYQAEVVKRLLRHGNMIAQVATGGGKSRIAKLVVMRIKRPTLFLTTRGILLHQMKDAFEQDMKLAVGVFGDGVWGVKTKSGLQEGKISPLMNVGMVQTFVQRLAEACPDDTVEVQNAQNAIRQATIALLAQFEVVIGEEAHEASGNSYYDILRHCKNAAYRLALTATPFMKEDEESNMRLMAAFGSIGIKVSEQTLIDRGILAKPYFKYVKVREKPRFLLRGTGWQAAYRIGIVTNEYRNAAIVEEAVQAVSHGLPVMILVQQTAHGDTLKELLREKGIKVGYIRGENDQKERKNALERLKSGSFEVLIGTTILDVGVDVPAVGMVVLAGGGKAQVALRQRIGRGLRAKSSGPNVCFIVDFTDDFNSHLVGHANLRQDIIKSTPGFVEGILPAGADFDYTGLGLIKRAA